MKYTGMKCSACGEVFTDTDDVVVCAECGTPHHRKCYRVNGECVNTVHHKDGFNWNKVNRPAEVKPENLEPEKPEEINVESIQVTTIPEFIENNIKLLDNTEKDGCTLRETLDFVHRNVLYYMPVFARIRNLRSGVSFNLVCFMLPQVYFANRKMWFWALLTSVISVILIIPMMISLIVSDSSSLPSGVAETINSNAGLINSLMEICNVADMIMRILLCLFANRLYYNYTTKTIRRMKKAGRDVSKETLNSAGGTKFVNIIIILLVTFTMILAVMSLLEFVLPMIF